MAIAPLPERGADGPALGTLDLPWPRPALHLVAPVPGGDAPVVDAGPDGAVGRRSPGPMGERPTGCSPRVRADARRRRHRVLLGLGLAGAAVALALPVSSLGGRPAAGVPGASTAPGAGSVYVVQSGDTLWSIAARMDRGGDPRPLAEAIARETGSTVVVPGERIRVP